jgi:hypothetical protein
MIASAHFRRAERATDTCGVDASRKIATSPAANGGR